MEDGKKAAVVVGVGLAIAGVTYALTRPAKVVGLIGDLNDDGVIDSADLDILNLYIAGAPISQISPLSEAEFMGRADVNEDGVVNVLDISALEQLIEAPLPGTATVYGIVTSAETGAPLSGVSVSLWSSDETEFVIATTTNGAGSFSLENILPGPYVLYFQKEGYETLVR